MSGLSERLEDWADDLFHRGELFNGTDEEAADLLREAASLIDQQEKALEAADELARCVKEEGPRRRDEAADAYRASTHPMAQRLAEEGDNDYPASLPAPEGEGEAS